MRRDSPYLTRRSNMPRTPCRPMGEHEIADLLLVKRDTVRQWGWRGLMPDRDHTVNRQPAWNERTIIRWAKRTGRWTDDVEKAYAKEQERRRRAAEQEAKAS